jgi:hypothetical protein
MKGKYHVLPHSAMAQQREWSGSDFSKEQLPENNMTLFRNVDLQTIGIEKARP